jgi:diguanylate cyclase (GGDEF)-like protein
MDPLTGLPNRRRFDEQLQLEGKRASRSGRPLSMLVADIDHFKSVNDQYGHASGDVVLRRVGAVLREAVRETDFVGRVGGEEFALILPEADVRGAQTLGERVRRRVEQAKVQLPGTLLSVTISIGAAGWQVGAPFDGADLFERADRCLYASKRGGRNRVTIDESTEAHRPAKGSSPGPSAS